MKKKYNNIYTFSYIKNKDIKETIEKRYNILIVLIIIIMLIMIVNLFVIQVIKTEFYTNKVGILTQNTITETSAPRGRIYDRNGKIIVDNEAVKVIYYNKQTGITSSEEIEIALKVSELISVDYKNINESDLRNFWVKQN